MARTSVARPTDSDQSDVENIAARNRLSVDETRDMLSGFMAALDAAESGDEA